MTFFVLYNNLLITIKQDNLYDRAFLLNAMRNFMNYFAQSMGIEYALQTLERQLLHFVLLTIQRQAGVRTQERTRVFRTIPLCEATICHFP